MALVVKIKAVWYLQANYLEQIILVTIWEWEQVELEDQFLIHTKKKVHESLIPCTAKMVLEDRCNKNNRLIQI
jgi:hypothetical protein